MPRSRTAGREPVKDNRARILEATVRLVRHYGHDKTTLADIAREIGVSTAYVYRTFASRLDILEAIVADRFEAHLREERAIVDAPGPAEERLRRLLVEDYEKAEAIRREDPRIHEIVVLAARGNWAATRAREAGLVDLIEELVRQGCAHGTFAVSDTRHAAKCIERLFGSIADPERIGRGTRDADPASVEDLARFSVAALASGRL